MTERLVLDIGGVVCEVCLQPPLQSVALVARYAAFLTAAAPDWQINAQSDSTSPNVGEGRIEYSEAVTQFRVAAYAGSIDLDGRCAAA